MSAASRPMPSPDDLANAPHREGARLGRLMLQRCDHCGRHRYPAAAICAHCRLAGASWVEAGGHGSVESYCRFHRAYWEGFREDLPYVVLQVRLDEDVRLYSNPVDIGWAELHVGLRVRAVFEPVTDEVSLVKFEKEAA